MSGWELLICWALAALAVFGIPGYFIGWWNGRRCLRAALDPGRLPPVDYDIRVVPVAPLRTAGRFPVDERQLDTLILWSEHQAAIDSNERDVQELITEAEQRIPARWRT